MAGCCHTGGALLGIGFIPLVLVAAVAYLGHKAYDISKDNSGTSGS